jgi:hypothetical protein
MPAEIETESDSDNGEQLRNNAFVNAAGDGQKRRLYFPHRQCCAAGSVMLK